MNGHRNRGALTAALLAVGFATLVGYKACQGAPQAPPEIVGQRLGPSAQVMPLEGGEPYPLSNEIVGVTVVNYFASWCAPCRAENPVLLQLRAEGVRVIGVAVRDEPAAARGFLDDLGDPFFRVMLEPTGGSMTALGLGADMPQTLVISANGEILMRHSGPLVGTDGEAAVEQIRELAGPR